jgi:hypothetical protein
MKNIEELNHDLDQLLFNGQNLKRESDNPLERNIYP